MTKIGFTGTQKSMTRAQKQALRNLLRNEAGSEFHHGDCMGADDEAHDIAEVAGLEIIIHPPENPFKRAFKRRFKERREPKPYLERNRDIVLETEWLIATPQEKKEQLRSGTWMTIRYGAKLNRRVTVVFPDGSMKQARHKHGSIMDVLGKPDKDTFTTS